MTPNERRLTVRLLQSFSDQLAYNACNDVPEEFWEDWTLEERRKFVKEFHEYNGNPHEYDENYLHVPDFAIVSFLAHKLKTDG